MGFKVSGSLSFFEFPTTAEVLRILIEQLEVVVEEKNSCEKFFFFSLNWNYLRNG